MRDSELIREVLAYMAPDASAADIAAEVETRYGVEVTAVNVRAVKSRVARGMNPGEHKTRARAVSRARPVPRPDDLRDSYSPPRRVIRSRPVPEATQPESVGSFSAADSANDAEDSETRAEYELYEWMDRTEAAIRRVAPGRPQSVTVGKELADIITGILGDPEFRAGVRKLYGYESRANPDGMITLTIYDTSPPEPYRAPRKRNGARTELACEFCPNRRPVPGANLYLVSSPVLGPSPRLLCQMHAMPETTVPGTNVTPYRVASEYTGAAIIVQEKSPYERLREQVIAASQRIQASIPGFDETEASRT